MQLLLLSYFGWNVVDGDYMNNSLLDYNER